MGYVLELSILLAYRTENFSVFEREKILNIKQLDDLNHEEILEYNHCGLIGLYEDTLLDLLTITDLVTYPGK